MFYAAPTRTDGYQAHPRVIQISGARTPGRRRHRLHSASRNQRADVRGGCAAIQKFRTHPAAKFKGFILDLRTIPALADQSIAIVNCFLDRGESSRRAPQLPEETMRYNAHPGDLSKANPSSS